MKHLALIAIVLWLLVLAWVAVSAAAPVPPAQPIPAPSADPGVERLQQSLAHGRRAMDQTLRSLAIGHRDDRTRVIALAPAPARSAPVEQNPWQNSDELAPARSVSMIYTAAGFQRAVVDGQYVAPGQRLADGGRVVAIAADSVTVQDGDGRHVLRLQPPLSALNGGGLGRGIGRQ